MSEDTEFTKLPLEERCTHKLWKARLHGYSEASKLFEEEEDEKAAIFNQFVGLVGKFVGDTNAAAQEKGLEAVFYFVQNAAVASKTVKDVMSVIVSKCIAAPKAKTKDWAVQIALMYIEIEKQEQVTEELLKGMEHKNPKIVAACAAALALCLREFGSKVISIKPIVKPVGALLEDRDKTVRDEARGLAVEIYRWIKDAIKPQLSSLKPIQLSELETEFEKVKGDKAVPTRYLRSQQVRQAKLAAEKEEGVDNEGNCEVDGEAAAVDPYDLMDPINVLSQIPSDFYEKLEAKKWQERKEAVDSCEKILDYPKFEKGDYSDFVRALLKVITKDSNVMVVGVAVKCMARLAAGLKKGFQPYAATVLPQLLEKFKEKKANVVAPLREAVDAIYPITTLEAIQEDVISSLESKNPAVKAETASFLARCFTKCTPTILNKKLLKALTTALLKTLNESDPTVRENSAEALGTAMKVVGEKAISPFMPDIDNLKLSKIKECSEKAVVVKAAPPPPAPAPAPKPAAAKPVRSKSDAAPPAAQQKTPPKANPPPKKVASGSKIKKATAGPVVAKPVSKKKDEDVDTAPLLPVNNIKHQRMLDEQKLKTLKWNFTVPRSEFVDLLKEQMTTAGFNKTLVSNMFHSNFKLHLKAIDSLNDDLSNVDAVVSNLDLILKWMTLRFFDTNPSVLLKGLDYLQNVFGLLIDNNYSVFDFEANSFIPYLVLKIGDPKDAVRDRVRAIFKQLSKMYPPGKIFTLLIEGLKTKNARQRTECLEELGNLIEEFGMAVCQPTPAAALKEISKQISDRDHSVRSAALNAIVKAWYIEGDKVYKLIGQISEKDLSLLEERIKRASKARPSLPSVPKSEVKEKEKEKEKEKSPESRLNTTFEAAGPEEDEEVYEPSPAPAPKPRPNAFEQNFFKDIDLAEPPIPKMDLIEIDDSFLNSPIQIPERIAAKLNKPVVQQAVVQQREDSEVDQVIRDLGSSNINVAFHAASKLRLILESHVRSLLTAYTDPIMDSLTLQLRLVNSYSLEKCGLILPQTYRMLFRIIDDIFGKKTSMGVAVKVGHLQNLLRELLITLVEDKTAKFAEGGYNKWINVFVSRIIEDSDHTNVTCAVLKLLYEVVGNPPENPKITDLTTKCLLKIIVLIKKGNSTWCEVLDLDEVFYECHLFFQAYPRHTWKDRPSIVPLKAVKTLLLALVGLKGKDIFFYLKKIENPCASELAAYLKRLLKTQPTTGKSPSSTRMSKAMSEHLSEIFMKIAYEETAKEGLIQFYEFKKQNPHLDLSSFLAPTSQYFRDYVENGLKSIERERGALNAGSVAAASATTAASAAAAAKKPLESLSDKTVAESTVPGISTDGSLDPGSGLAQYYLDKLRMFQARVGIHLSDLPDFKSEPIN